MRQALSAWIAVLVLGCGRLQFDHEPVFHTPLVEQTRLEKKGENRGEAPSKLPDVREKALRIADALLRENSSINDYGDSDIGRLSEAIRSTLPWRARDGVPALARQAQIRRAFNADGRPLPGDIVLFHNQYDRNRNYETDDWHTGCGIVIEVQRDRFVAVIRTGHRPRRVTVSPLYPSVRKDNKSIVNSFVRIPAASDPEDTEYLAGQLYAGHIDLEKMPSR